MKEKVPSKNKQHEWERLLHANNIYMGDHMTRTWTKDGRHATVKSKPSSSDNAAVDDAAKNDRTVAEPNAQLPADDNHAPTEPHSVTMVQPSKSQYSLRNGKRKIKSGKEIMLHHNITDEDLLEWQQSFDSLLNSPAGRYVFKVFLESEIADENLKFWLACEELKNTKHKRVEKRVQDIYDTYINVYSPHEINIDYKMREDIVDQLKFKMDVSIFTEAQHQIYTLMHRDSYPRFLSSTFTAELMKELAGRRQSSTKSMKKSKAESTVKAATGFMSCCYCRRHDNKPDSNDLVEERPDGHQTSVELNDKRSGSTRLAADGQSAEGVSSGRTDNRTNTEDNQTVPGCVRRDVVAETYTDTPKSSSSHAIEENCATQGQIIQSD